MKSMTKIRSKILVLILVLVMLSSITSQAELGGELTGKERHYFSPAIQLGDRYDWSVSTNFSSESNFEQFSIEIVETPTYVNYTNVDTVLNITNWFAVSIDDVTIEPDVVLSLFSFIMPNIIEYSNGETRNVFEEMANNDVLFGYFWFSLRIIPDASDEWRHEIINDQLHSTYVPYDENVTDEYVFDIETGLMVESIQRVEGQSQVNETRYILDSLPQFEGSTTSLSTNLSDSSTDTGSITIMLYHAMLGLMILRIVIPLYYNKVSHRR